MRKDAQVTIRLRGALRDELEALAEADKRSLSSYIELALEEHVERAKQSSKHKRAR
jgi:predicted transcriptional regulator